MYPILKAPEGVFKKDKKMTSPIQFIKEARAELSKVVWPSRTETIRITIAVIVLSLVVAVFLGAVDFGLTKLFEWGVAKV